MSFTLNVYSYSDARSSFLLWLQRYDERLRRRRSLPVRSPSAAASRVSCAVHRVVLPRWSAAAVLLLLRAASERGRQPSVPPRRPATEANGIPRSSRCSCSPCPSSLMLCSPAVPAKAHSPPQLSAARLIRGTMLPERAVHERQGCRGNDGDESSDPIMPPISALLCLCDRAAAWNFGGLRRGARMGQSGQEPPKQEDQLTDALHCDTHRHATLVRRSFAPLLPFLPRSSLPPPLSPPLLVR